MTEPTTVCSEMPKCLGAGIAVKTGRKYRAVDAVQKAETQLEHNAFLGTVESRQSRTWEPNTDPIRLGQQEAEAEVGAGGGASFCQGTANTWKNIRP